MSISAEEWDKAAKDLESFYTPVKFQLGELTVTCKLERASVFKNAIMIYVNGEFRGEWLSGKTKHPEQQFLNTKFIYACKGQVRKAAQKMSKKRRKDLGIDLDKKVEYFTPTWTSIKSLIRHLKKIDGLTIVEAE